MMKGSISLFIVLLFILTDSNACGKDEKSLKEYPLSQYVPCEGGWCIPKWKKELRDSSKSKTIIDPGDV